MTAEGGDYDEIRERVERDPDFRDRLLADPKSTLSEELGVVIPASMAIRAIEERDNEILIILPSIPSATPVPDEGLEALAGAGSSQNWTTCSDCGATNTCQQNTYCEGRCGG